MTSESGLWNTFKRNLSPYGKLVRIESSTGLGIPDVNCLFQLTALGKPIEGWIELKEADWPKRDSTPLLIPKLSREQVIWQNDWYEAGGRVGTVLQVGRDYFYLTPVQLKVVFYRQMFKSQLMDPHNEMWMGGVRFPTGKFLRTYHEKGKR